ncbi:MAG: ATP-binding cassette domain-containing protein [Saprospiraceae bacterium]|nr:ATP-binding cassette domain-containing protein [Saprospiraceae bacterium]
MLDAPNPLKDKDNALAINTFTDSIAFENVYFSYIEEKIAVENFNLTIKKGETVALVGQSGSGKSTIAALLNRFYDVDKGSIKIDGHDLRDLKQHDFRKMIAYIPQEAHLFNDTIKENLLLGKPDASMEEIIHACKVANAYDFITETENGFDTTIGDRGSKLSGGQRQRLTIARAVLKNPPILLLDEATSALDAESEKLVQDALNKLLTNRTSIVIAHRFSTIKNADKIVVMKEGNIIEVGNHESLVKKEGEYYKLVQLQGLE